MARTQTTHEPHETLAANHHEDLVCWKSIFAGATVAFLIFALLSALGTGIAGMTAESLIRKEEGGSALFSLGGLWLGLSVVISIFCGSYFASRVARYVTYKVGAANGVVVAALFFGVMMIGAGNLIGGVATGIGKAAQGAGSGAASLGSSPWVQDALNKAIGTSTLKSDPKVVAEGLVARLVVGDTESAKEYLAYQTGSTPAEVDARATQLQADFTAAAKKAAQKTADAVGDTGLIVFAVLLFGIAASLLGGAFGAHANTDRPFHRATAHSTRTAAAH